MGQLTKSRRGKIYIDDAGWGPEADSVEYRYRVPFGVIHVFIGKISESQPEPNICTDIVEMARCARPARVQPGRKHAFVGFVHGADLEEGSMSGGETTIYTGDESSTGETESIYQLQDSGLGGYSDGDSISDPYAPPSGATIFMARIRPMLNSSTATAITSGSTATTTARASAHRGRRVKFYLSSWMPWRLC